jgi:hypoxanthine-DNA glycosylase
VLILGSLPGPESLRRGEYYGHPQNQFWKILSSVLDRPVPERYLERVRLLKRSGIALWDSLARCRRPSALDSAIRDPEPNDLAGLLSKHPGIRRVFANGRTAAAFAKRLQGVEAAYLPSTSPANAAIPYARKAAAWRAIRKWL